MTDKEQNRSEVNQEPISKDITGMNSRGKDRRRFIKRVKNAAEAKAVQWNSGKATMVIGITHISIVACLTVSSAQTFSEQIRWGM